MNGLSIILSVSKSTAVGMEKWGSICNFLAFTNHQRLRLLQDNKYFFLHMLLSLNSNLLGGNRNPEETRS